MDENTQPPPAKRRRLSTQDSTEVDIIVDAKMTGTGSAATGLPKGTAYVNSSGNTDSRDEAQLEKERRVGITAYVNPAADGFSGVLKQRYTDFLVNEVLPDGRVLHLENLSPKKARKDAEDGEKQAEEHSATVKTGKDEPLKEEQIKKEQKDTQMADATNDVKQTEAGSIDGKKQEQSGNTNETKQEAEEQQNGAVDQVKISEEHSSTLETIFGADTVKEILSLYNAVLRFPKRKPREFRPVTSPVIAEKDARTQAHQSIRKIFSSKLETKTNEDNNTISVAAMSLAVKQRGGDGTRQPRVQNKMGWEQLGGEYLHFTLYKENKDTMEAISYLSSQLKMNVRSFQFGGTKDRRGVTVQRASVYRVHAEQLARAGRQLRGSRVGDFEYQRDGLSLGELGGNEFVITLRDCHFPGEEGLNIHNRLRLAEKVVNVAVESFQQGGFINYYGLQRFGSFTTSTDSIGMKLLQGNLKGAVDDILSFSPETLAAAEARNSSSTDNAPNPGNHGTAISSDDLARAEAINIWLTTHDANKAGQKLPRKFSAESNIIRHLGHRDRRQDAPNNGLSRLGDFQGALMTIPRNLRLMYVHAYQSLVWNVVAGERWKRFGAEVVEGDLVLESEYTAKMAPAATSEDTASTATAAAQPTVDESGEPIISASASANSSSTSHDALPDTDTIYARAHALTPADIATSLFNITDIVLPLPGYDVIYPSSSLGAFYKEFMASEEGGRLDPYDMRRSWKDVSLSGGYRKVVVRPQGEVSADVKRYEREEEQMVDTDLERLIGKRPPKAGAGTSAAGAAVPATAGQAEHAQPANGDAAVVDTTTTTTTTSNNVASEFGLTPPDKIAVILRLRLGPSQYATMALRELMKAGGVVTYKPDFGGGR